MATLRVCCSDAIRRLAPHPCVWLWSGCNECGGGAGDITDFALPIVAQEDDSRPIWPAAPAHNGWKSGVSTLTGFPNGRNLTLGGPPANESHGPYQFGGTAAFAPANGATALSHAPASAPRHVPSSGGVIFAPQMLPSSAPQQCTEAWFAAGCLCGPECNEVGPSHAGNFASEFGCVGMSSFESLSGTLSPVHWGLHAGHEVWAQRNYPCDNLIGSFFGDAAVSALDTDPPGAPSLQRQAFQCMLSQALYLKTDIESRKARNVWGLLLWQMTEIWPTGGWGSVEYPSNRSEGSVVGGRWKTLHHFLARFLYTPVATAVCEDGRAYVRNDGAGAFAGTLNVTAVHLDSGEETTAVSARVQLEGGAGSLTWVDAQPALHACPPTRCILVSRVYGSDGAIVAENEQLLSPPSALVLPSAAVSFQVASAVSSDRKSVAVTVTADKTAVFVALTTAAPGYFEPNWFMARAGTTEVRFVMFEGSNDDAEQVLATLRSTTRIEHLAQHGRTNRTALKTDGEVLAAPLYDCPLEDPLCHDTISNADISVRSNISYGTAFNKLTRREQPLLLDLYDPHSSPSHRRPVAVVIHGGGWKPSNNWNGKSEAKFIDTARRFARRGFVAISIDYRCERPFGGDALWVDAVADGRQALRWIAAQAEQLRLDTERIVLYGTSAGAITIAGMVYFHQHGPPPPRVRAAVSISGCLFNDTASVCTPGEPANSSCFSPPGRHVWNALYDAGSPRSTPYLDIHGTADPTVPFDNATIRPAAKRNQSCSATDTQAFVTAAGAPNDLVPIPGAGHVPQSRWSPPYNVSMWGFLLAKLSNDAEHSSSEARRTMLKLDETAAPPAQAGISGWTRFLQCEEQLCANMSRQIAHILEHASDLDFIMPYTGDVWTGNAVPDIRGKSRCYENATHTLTGPLQDDPSFRFSSRKHKEGDGSGRFLCVPASDAAVQSWAGPIRASGVKIMPVIEAIEFSDWSIFEGQHGLEFFDTCAAVARRYGFSGWSLDWEPKSANSPSSSSAAAVAELEGFASFLSAFAARLKLHGLELSTAEPNRDLINTTVQSEPYPVNVTGYRSVANSGARVLTMSTYYGVMPRDAADKHFFTKELMAWQSITRPDKLSIGFGVIYRSWASGACAHGGHGSSDCLSLAVDASIAQGIKSIALFQLDAFGWPQIINGRRYPTIAAPWPPADWWPELRRLQNHTRPKTEDGAGIKHSSSEARRTALKTDSERRNVVMMVMDDARPDLRLAFGQDFMITPNADRLAREGTVFSRAYTQLAVCSPSRNSFLSGRRPDTTKVWNFLTSFRDVGPDWLSLPQYFKVHNYTTLGAGKLFHTDCAPWNSSAKRGGWSCDVCRSDRGPGNCDQPPNLDQPYSWSQDRPYHHPCQELCPQDGELWPAKIAACGDSASFDHFNDYNSTMASIGNLRYAARKRNDTGAPFAILNGVFKPRKIVILSRIACCPSR